METGVSQQTILPGPRHFQVEPREMYLYVDIRHLLPVECNQQLSLHVHIRSRSETFNSISCHANHVL